MTAALLRNATPANPANFSGTVPAVLEIAYTGNAAAGSPPAPQLNTDLFSVLLHEFTHGLGMSVQLTTCANELTDGDYDINAGLVNGNNFSLIAALGSGAHTACQQCPMTAAIPTGLRRLACAADVLALVTSPNPGWSNIDFPRREFLSAGTGAWTTAANRVGAKVPGTQDDAACRHGRDVVGDIIVTLSGAAVCRDLLVSQATRVRTFAHTLDVTEMCSLNTTAPRRPRNFLSNRAASWKPWT